MSVDDIVDSVLGTRCGYVKGLGYGPKPKSFKASETRTYELEEKLKKTQDELQTCQTKFETTTTQLEGKLDTMMSNYSQLLQFLVSSGTQLPPSILSPLTPNQGSNESHAESTEGLERRV
ncbi:uncharacterized protein LOC127809536 [Diospyros lotus]|uniref:uncharacterized protein LOC127809536 n=1 Tax=Diospyros lotus TaxID=55363 RepID=UPI002252A83E|nr:uncharacterized protein LOC127809536 [Diospyros lotus]